ncbi:hypothetical protein QBC38DRAFT_451416 [Podospora fimiseda]|uniref:Zn(2)-C6 fungal-type domain-containing protein n=1 Tax=Podospora fimiseda TaxID=252190 RepID=A0AAN7BXJ0_9PEZI|nr:hypothetical protein QBC38DRAFT_451416 [Podospora fimiseda]
MDELLGLGVGESNRSCGSIADLQEQLHDILSTRVTPSSAQHVTETFDIRSSAVFDVPITPPENEALETSSHIDPLLGGVQTSITPALGPNGEQVATRRINAIDALTVQATDNNALQKVVAGHIIASLGQVDSSQWVVRQVSRTDQGWTFSYDCKDSQAEWDRQSSKTPAKTAIAEWSEKGGQDPIHLARPAFDCRGSLRISFVKSTRTIDIKYEHTPLHKTVEELIELLAPPPLAPIIKTPAKNAKTPKQPKEPRPPKVPKTKTPRPRKRPQGEDGVPGAQGSQPKKRRKKKESTAPGALDGNNLPPEMLGALPVGNPSERQLYNTQVSVADYDQTAGSSGYPEGLVGAEASPAPAVFNLPPGETERRRDVANQLLRDADIDPATLSVEQFNIFANQSPELQKDSLAMLVKYGAERLRIVHPAKEGSSTDQPTPQTSPDPTAVNTPKPKRSRKKKSEAVVPEGEGVAALAAAPRPVEGKKPPRGVCDNCRNTKQPRGSTAPKCDKKRPSCQNCLAQGLSCNYSHRQRAGVGESTAGEEVAEEAPAPAPVPEPVVEILDDESEDLGSPGFHSAHDAIQESLQEPTHVPDLHSHSIESPSDSFSQVHNIYNHSGGLGFSQTDTVPEASHTNISSAGIDTAYTSTSIPETPSAILPDFIYPPQPQQPQVDYHEQTTTTTAVQPTQHHQPQPQQTNTASPQTRARPRRSLPTSQPSYSNSTSATTTVNNHNDNWQSMSASNAAIPTRTSPRQARKKAVAQAYDDVRQQNSGWTTANHSTAQTSQPVQNTSPYQAAAHPVQQNTSPYQATAQLARAKSRQGNRSQTHTPVNSMSAGHQPPNQPSQTMNNNTGYSTATTTQPSSSNQAYNYNQQYSTANTGSSARNDSSNDRIAYQPYSNTQPASTSSNSYSSFDNYNARPTNNTSNPASQNVTSSYSGNSASSNAGQWGSAPSASTQARNAHTYNNNQAASANSYMNTATAQPSASLQGFNVRPQPPATRSSTATYAQESQQHHRQQRQQQQPQQQNYNNYQTQQQPPQQASNNQGWWTGSNNPSSTYSSATAGSGANDAYSNSGATSHGHGGQQQHHQQQQQQHHHRSMNLSSHTYSSMDGDLFDMLRHDPSG